MNSWSITERHELHGVGFPCRTRHLAAIQLPVRDNKARVQQLLCTILHLLLPHEYGIAVLITQASHSSVLHPQPQKNSVSVLSLNAWAWTWHGKKPHLGTGASAVHKVSEWGCWWDCLWVVNKTITTRCQRVTLHGNQAGAQGTIHEQKTRNQPKFEFLKIEFLTATCLLPVLPSEQGKMTLHVVIGGIMEPIFHNHLHIPKANPEPPQEHIPINCLQAPLLAQNFSFQYLLYSDATRKH